MSGVVKFLCDDCAGCRPYIIYKDVAYCNICDTKCPVVKFPVSPYSSDSCYVYKQYQVQSQCQNNPENKK